MKKSISMSTSPKSLMKKIKKSLIKISICIIKTLTALLSLADWKTDRQKLKLRAKFILQGRTD